MTATWRHGAAAYTAVPTSGTDRERRIAMMLLRLLALEADDGPSRQRVGLCVAQVMLNSGSTIVLISSRELASMVYQLPEDDIREWQLNKVTHSLRVLHRAGVLHYDAGAGGRFAGPALVAASSIDLTSERP